LRGANARHLRLRIGALKGQPALGLLSYGGILQQQRVIHHTAAGLAESCENQQKEG
jgi:hypothetical protein